MQPTPEQQLIIDSDTDFLRVIAFAGTGKTSTLVKFAEARPDKTFLYVAFNKSIQLEAEGKFPANVKAKTSHGLAFPKFGAKYANAGKLVPDIKVNQVIEALNIKLEDSSLNYVYAKHVLETLKRFLASAESGFKPAMVEGVGKEAKFTAAQVLSSAKQLWEKMCDVNDSSVGMVHDGYLKLYQLSGPRLNFDYVLFDEAQDSNPVTADIVLQQKSRKVFVGDSHQAIYGFRGAQNAMENIKPTQTLTLTNSFRFGSNMAAISNALLKVFKGEDRKIVGLKGKGVIGKVNKDEQYAVISRANATLFDEAISAINSKKTPYFVGGVNGANFQQVLDVYHLYTKNKGAIRDHYFRSFPSYSMMKEFADETDDREIKSLCRVVEKYDHDIPELIQRIKAEAADDIKQAGIILSSGHKCKGLEFKQVKLTDDFVDLFDEDGELKRPEVIDKEEVNLLYVAVTRAEHTLEINSSLTGFINHLRAVQKRLQAEQGSQPAAKSAAISI